MTHFVLEPHEECKQSRLRTWLATYPSADLLRRVHYMSTFRVHGYIFTTMSLVRDDKLQFLAKIRIYTNYTSSGRLLDKTIHLLLWNHCWFLLLVAGPGPFLFVLSIFRRASGGSGGYSVVLGVQPGCAAMMCEAAFDAQLCRTKGCTRWGAREGEGGTRQSGRVKWATMWSLAPLFCVSFWSPLIISALSVFWSQLPLPLRSLLVTTVSIGVVMIFFFWFPLTGNCAIYLLLCIKNKEKGVTERHGVYICILGRYSSASTM